MAFTTEELRLAQPDAPEQSRVEAWYMADSVDDQRLPNRRTPNVPVSSEALAALGVLSWHIDPAGWESDERLAAIRKVRGYSYHDVIEISRDTLPGYDAKLRSFFEEHLHADEEIRYILAGTGYFDVRDADDAWIRIAATPGTMIVLPEGMYHRFTLDSADYLKALRLFVGEPVWTPHNRPQEAHPSRSKYLGAFVGQGVAA